MRNDFESNYLAHHGILGMKWGKKNGPPYPLGASDHSSSEKKAGWRKSLGGGKVESKRSKRKTSTKVDNAESAGEKEKKGLTDNQKKAIKIGAAVAVTAIAAYGAYKVSKDPRVKALVNVGKVSAQQAALRNKQKLSSIDLAKSDKLISDALKSAENAINRAGVSKVTKPSFANEGKKVMATEAALKAKFGKEIDATQAALKKSLYNQEHGIMGGGNGPSLDELDKMLKKATQVADNANKVSKSTAHTLEFGSSTQKFTEADMNKLLGNAEKLYKSAQTSSKVANSNTVSFDYAQELLKKNKGTLSGYTMKDLKDLDLY